MRRPRGRGERPKNNDKYRVNERIRVPQVRLVDDSGEMLGVMSSREALEIARNKGLDLIEIAPNAKPPTCKIMDYGKWKYENKKKANEARKKQNIVALKEVQLRPRTEKNDIDTKLKHATRFLLSGDKVKLNLRFSGREMAHQEIGFQVVKGVAEQLLNIANIEVEPKKEGRHVFAIIAPDAVKIKDYKKAQAKAKESSKEEAKADDEKKGSSETA